jgi:hypothetical protein
MRSATTKERATSCYFLGTGTSIVSGVSNAASDWAGSCAFIIKRPHEKAVRPVFDQTGLRDEFEHMANERTGPREELNRAWAALADARTRTRKDECAFTPT